MRIGSLFSGAGMLDVAVQSVLGGTVAWHCEINPAAASVLAHHYPDVPNLHNITAVDWNAVEPVDVITGGWPCQPFSLAGKRKGAADERALWPYVARAVRMVRPRLVFLENVAAIVTAGELARATAELAALGYVGSWTCVRASDVGAPHRRERCFIVAADTRRWELQRRRGPGHLACSPRADQGEGDQRQRDGHAVDGGSCAATDATRDGRNEGWAEPARLVGRFDASECSTSAADADGTPGGRVESGCIAPGQTEGALREAERRARRGGGTPTADPGRDGREGDPEPDCRKNRATRSTEPRGIDPVGRVLAWGPYGPAIRRWESITGRPAPEPTELNSRGGRRLRPAFPEWMMGWPLGWVTAVPGISRNDQLRICGNGVVPQQAAYALRLLLAADRAEVA